MIRAVLTGTDLPEGRLLYLPREISAPGSHRVLDQPTNLLDLSSIERLEPAPAETRAALVLASHDRPFLAPLTNQAGEIGPEGKDHILRIGRPGTRTGNINAPGR